MKCVVFLCALQAGDLLVPGGLLYLLVIEQNDPSGMVTLYENVSIDALLLS